MPDFLGIRTKRGLRPPPAQSSPPPIPEDQAPEEPPRVEPVKALARVMAPRPDAVIADQLHDLEQPAPERDTPLQ